MKNMIMKIVAFLIEMIPDETIEEYGFKHGKEISKKSKSKGGDAYETVETAAQQKIAIYMKAVEKGIDSDD